MIYDEFTILSIVCHFIKVHKSKFTVSDLKINTIEN